ncbi:MAG: hypothetical protein ACKVS8_09465 [Phycisphaerales bacterium]
MRIIIRPVVDRQREIDLTQRLTAVIAEELWRLYGGNEQLNWLEAELHLKRIVGEARAEARVMEVLVEEPPVTTAFAEETAVIAGGGVVGPRRARRSTPGQARSVSRSRTVRAGQSQLAIIA